MYELYDERIEQIQYMQSFVKGDRKRFLAYSQKLLANNRFKELASYIPQPLFHETSHLTSAATSIPTSLVFAYTEKNESILFRNVYRHYSGSPSYCYTHMLVDLPDSFQIREAIKLWESPFYDNNEVKNEESDPQEVEAFPFKILKEQYVDVAVKGFRGRIASGERDKAAGYLEAFVLFFLVQQAYLQQPGMQQALPRILMSVPAPQVACLIFALSTLLPKGLLQNITFSTYEHDIRDKPYHICGIGPSPEPGNPVFSHDMTDFLLNQPLQENYLADIPERIRNDLHPDLIDKLAHYANVVKKAFSIQQLEIRDPHLRELIEIHDKKASIGLEEFLASYYHYFNRSTEVEPVINPSIENFSQYSSNMPAGKMSALDELLGKSKGADYPDATKEEGFVPGLMQPLPSKLALEHNSSIVVNNQEYEQAPPHTPFDNHPIAGAGNAVWQEHAGDNGLPVSEGNDSIAMLHVEEEVTGSDITQTLSSENRDSKHALPISSTYIMTPLEIMTPLADPKQAEKLLRDERLRQQMIALMFQNLEWVQTRLAPVLIALLEVAGKRSEQLSLLLNKLITEIQHHAIEAVQMENAQDFQDYLDILFSISPYRDKNNENSWLVFLDELAAGDQLYKFFRLLHTWPVREQLLDVAKEVLPAENGMYDPRVAVLINVKPADFGRLLMADHAHAPELRLPTEWSYQAIKNLVPTNSLVMPSELVSYFEQRHALIGQMFADIAKMRYQDWWEVLFNLFSLLQNSHYRYKKELVVYFLEAPLSRDDAKSIFRELSARDRLEFFEQYENDCITLFPSSTLSQYITQWSFSELPLTWQRLSNLSSRLGTWQEAELRRCIPRIALMLENDINSSIQLGMLFGLLLQYKLWVAEALFSTMAQRAKELLVKALDDEPHKEMKPEQAQSIKWHFLMYMQFAFNADVTHESSPVHTSFERLLLKSLLFNADERVFVFVDEEVRSWQPELQARWSSTQKLYRRLPVAHVAAFHAESTDAVVAALSALAERQPSAVVLPAEMQVVRKRLNRVKRKRGAKVLAQFWLENYNELMAMKEQQGIDPDDEASLQLAYAFYRACKVVERAPKNSRDRQKAEDVIAASGDYDGGHVNFTRRERRLINKMSKHVNKRAKKTVEVR